MPLLICLALNSCFSLWFFVLPLSLARCSCSNVVDFLQSSGVAVSDDCVTKFQELKLGHNYKYVVCKMNDSLTEIVVEKTGAPNATYDEFLAQLPANDSRYAVVDFDYEEEGAKRDKIVFALWNPDSASIKKKMLFTSSLQAFKKKLVGIGAEIQATDKSEIDRQAVLEKISRV
jgi:cofilin